MARNIRAFKTCAYFTDRAHENRAAQMHFMYTAPKQNVSKIISLRILVVPKRLSICVKLETRNIKKKYRLLPGRKHFCLKLSVNGRRNHVIMVFFLREQVSSREKCLEIQNCVNCAPN